MTAITAMASSCKKRGEEIENEDDDEDVERRQEGRNKKGDREMQREKAESR